MLSKRFLPSLPVSNDELTLSTTNGHQTVHGLDASLHWLPHRDAGNDARGLQTYTPAGLGAKGSLMERKKKTQKKKIKKLKL